MSIRTKTLSVIGLTVLVLVIVLYGLSQSILLKSYEALEQETVERNMMRVRNAVDGKIGFLHNTSMDWAHWDDTYAYIQDLNDEYIESNILASVFEYYDLEFMLFVNLAGEIVFSQGYDLDTQELVTIAQDLRQFVSQNAFLTHPLDENGDLLEDGVAGIVLLADTSIMIAATPILPSDIQGAAMGALVWGRYIDDPLLDTFSEQTQLALSVSGLTHDKAPAFDNAQPINLDVSTTIERIDESTIAGYTLLHDIQGNPALILKAEMPRSIYQQGQKSISYFLISLIFVGVILAGIVGLLLEKSVLSRLFYLNNHVSDIQQSGDMSSRVRMEGNDELTSLSNNINIMLESLQAQEKIKLARDNALATARLKAEILANVSHDARTPLTVILMRSEMLAKGIYGKLTDKQVEVLDHIIIGSQQLLTFINNMLEGAQLETGQLKLEIGETEPAKLLKTIQTTLEPLAARKNLRFETELSDDVPEVLYGDEKRLERILINLGSNAIKFTDQGEVRVKIYQPHHNQWALEVRDTGAGISPEHQEQIFVPFWKVDSSKTRAVNSGVGLGLSIVHELVELMDGTVTVKSQPAAGSVFSVILPLQLPVKGSPHAEAATHPRH